MLSLLPLAGGALLVLAFADGRRGWRQALVGAATVWSVAAVFVTETLSLVRWLRPGGLAIAWLAIDIAVLAVVLRSCGPRISLRDLAARAVGGIAGLPRTSLMLMAGTAVVVCLVGVTAVVSPPNTADAMLYHMPRLVHWLGHGSLAFFPTQEAKQLHMSPGAEFLRLQLHALAGNDRLDNLVQWGAYVGCVIGVSLVAGALGAGVGAQVIAAVLTASIPQGILQASGAKNDWVVAFWLVVLTYHLLRFRHDPSTARGLAVSAGLGLALLTKATAYVVAPPLIAGLALSWPGDVRRAFGRRLPLVLLGVAALTAGHAARNQALYGSPLGPPAESPVGVFKYTNDTLAIPAVLANVVRNAALHLGTPSPAANGLLTRALGRVIRAVGADPDDPRTTWSFTTFRVPDMTRHETSAGNPLHLLLIAVTVALCVLGRDRGPRGESTAIVIGMVAAFVLFCALLRWQPWHSRLHLPLFVVGAAPAAVMLSRAWTPRVLAGTGVLLLGVGVPFALGNASRPLAWPGDSSILTHDRMALYFAERRDLIASHLAAARAVTDSGCREVAIELVLGEHWEYPFLLLLEAERRDLRVSHATVLNESARYAAVEPARGPCAIVCLPCLRGEIEPDDDYVAVWSSGAGRVLVRRPFAGAEPVKQGRPSAPGPPGPRADLVAVPRRARVGDRLTAGLDVRNPPDGPGADLYVGIALAGRQVAMFRDGLGGLGSPIELGRPAEFPRTQPVPPGSRVRDDAFLRFTVPNDPAAGGRYLAFAVLVRSGESRSGRFQLEDILAYDVREIVATP